VVESERREALQTLVGLYEILTDELGPGHRRDFEHFVRGEDQLFQIKLARMEEKIAALRVLIGALGAALLGVGGALAVLAG
jgi:hypothetical protein